MRGLPTFSNVPSIVSVALKDFYWCGVLSTFSVVYHLSLHKHLSQGNIGK